MADRKILVIGALGQVGQELVFNLRAQYGAQNVVASDLKMDENSDGPFEILNALDKDKMFEIVKKYQITDVYHLAALLSATAEKQIEFAWQLNMDSLFHVLNLAKDKHIQRIFWPSSIAVFGPNTPRDNTPQHTTTDPTTVYGISKLAGERWCEYYHNKFGVDVRSIRYPGLIGYKTLPGGGTTDYAVDIYHQALKSKSYECFLKEDAALPMMYMEDAIRATLELMHADPKRLTIWSSYNLGGISFTPAEIANEIKKIIPEFEITYQPDFRQQIAESWPSSIDDSYAQKDWDWKIKYDLEKMSVDMLQQLSN